MLIYSSVVEKGDIKHTFNHKEKNFKDLDSSMFDLTEDEKKTILHFQNYNETINKKLRNNEIKWESFLKNPPKEIKEAGISYDEHEENLKSIVKKIESKTKHITVPTSTSSEVDDDVYDLDQPIPIYHFEIKENLIQRVLDSKGDKYLPLKLHYKHPRGFYELQGEIFHYKVKLNNSDRSSIYGAVEMSAEFKSGSFKYACDEPINLKNVTFRFTLPIQRLLVDIEEESKELQVFLGWIKKGDKVITSDITSTTIPSDIKPDIQFCINNSIASKLPDNSRMELLSINNVNEKFKALFPEQVGFASKKKHGKSDGILFINCRDKKLKEDQLPQDDEVIQMIPNDNEFDAALRVQSSQFVQVIIPALLKSYFDDSYFKKQGSNEYRLKQKTKINNILKKESCDVNFSVSEFSIKYGEKEKEIVELVLKGNYEVLGFIDLKVDLNAVVNGDIKISGHDISMNTSIELRKSDVSIDIPWYAWAAFYAIGGWVWAKGIESLIITLITRSILENQFGKRINSEFKNIKIEEIKFEQLKDLKIRKVSKNIKGIDMLFHANI